MPQVKLFANLRKIAGKKELTVNGSSLRRLLDELLSQQPALAAHLIENGTVRPHVILTINGHPTQNVDTPLLETDEIAIFPPVAGG